MTKEFSTHRSSWKRIPYWNPIFHYDYRHVQARAFVKRRNGRDKRQSVKRGIGWDQLRMKRSAAKGGFARTRADFTINLSRSFLNRSSCPYAISQDSFDARAHVHRSGRRISRRDRRVRWLGPSPRSNELSYLSFSNERLLSILSSRWYSFLDENLTYNSIL